MDMKVGTKQQNGAELVVRSLEAHGVSHVFGIPGAKIDAVFNALDDSRIKTVVCRHKQNAAFIAGGAVALSPAACNRAITSPLSQAHRQRGIASTTDGSAAG
jgi:acetolactate synthase-1/2/3 large subunit